MHVTTTVLQKYKYNGRCTRVYLCLCKLTSQIAYVLQNHSVPHARLATTCGYNMRCNKVNLHPSFPSSFSPWVMPSNSAKISGMQLDRIRELLLKDDIM